MVFFTKKSIELRIIQKKIDMFKKIIFKHIYQYINH